MPRNALLGVGPVPELEAYARTEASRQFTEASRQFTEANRQFAEANRQFAEAGRQFAEASCQFAEAHRQFAEFFHAIAPSRPDAEVFSTIPGGPDSILARQIHMDAVIVDADEDPAGPSAGQGRSSNSTRLNDYEARDTRDSRHGRDTSRGGVVATVVTVAVVVVAVVSGDAATVALIIAAVTMVVVADVTVGLNFAGSMTRSSRRTS